MRLPRDILPPRGLVVADLTWGDAVGAWVDAAHPWDSPLVQRPEPEWPDVSELLVYALEADGLGMDDPVLAATDTPPDLAGLLFLRVHVLGGMDDGVTDRTRFDLEAFAPTRVGGHRLASAARNYILHRLPGTNPGGRGLVDATRTDVRPRKVFYRNPDVERVVGTYSIDTRLQ